MSWSENSIDECRIHVWKSELQLTMRIDHAVRQLVNSNVQNRKSKTEFGMLMHCGLYNFGGSCFPSVFSLRSNSHHFKMTNVVAAERMSIFRFIIIRGVAIGGCGKFAVQQ